MSSLWLVFDIGCLECEEPSKVIGLYKNHEDALIAKERSSYDWGRGRHSVEIFEVEVSEKGEQLVETTI